jgi:transposase
MAIVGGLDLHRKQVTFDVVDTEIGVASRGRIAPADRERFRGWLAQFAGQQVDLAVEGCTGWRFVIEECQAAGVRPHLAEPADVAGLKGPSPARQDRPARRPASAGAAGGGHAAGVLDPAGTHAGGAGEGPAV